MTNRHSCFQRLWLSILLCIVWLTTVGATRRDIVTKARALAYLYQGADIHDIARTFGCCTRTIRRWRQRYETYGTVSYFPRRGGPRSSWRRRHTDCVIEILQRKPSIYLRELGIELNARFGSNFSLTTIWRKCRAERFTHKLLTRRFSEADPSVELQFWRCMEANNIHVNQLVWFDECYICRKSGNRTRGWSLRYGLQPSNHQM